jgi:predicted RNase H-like HicB family nuclease
MMRYSVVVIRGEDHGFYVTVPLLPGCFSQGETVEEALDHAREAIAGHVAALRDLDEEIPLERDVPLLLTLDVNQELARESGKRTRQASRAK